MGWRCLRLLLVLIYFVTGLSFGGAMAAETSGPTLAQDEGSVQLAQEKKRKKGKKKRKKKGATDEGTGEAAPADGEAAPAAGAAGPANGMHAKQEGVETPYKYQVSLLSDFAINNEQTGDAKTGTADYDLRGKFGFVFAKSIIVGLGLDYSESSFKTEEDTNSSSEYLIRPFFDYVFGNLDNDEMLFFVELGFGIGSSKSKAGEVESSTSSTQFGLGLGLHYFVDSNVAFTGEFSYDTGTRKVKDVDEPTKFSSIHLMRLGFSLFL